MGNHFNTAYKIHLADGLSMDHADIMRTAARLHLLTQGGMSTSDAIEKVRPLAGK